MKKIYALVLLSIIFTFLENVSAAQQSPCMSHSLITMASDLLLKAKPTDLTVLDLGTGSGKNIVSLLKKGATVYAYDADPDSIKDLRKKFKPLIKRNKFIVEEVRFEDITALPMANLIIAWRSLPFMEKDKFPAFWQKIENSLQPKGIFVGTFFGEQHKTKRPLDRLPHFRLNREEVLSLFKDFHIIAFHEEIEYDEEVSKEWGADQYEHLYMVVAQKKAPNPRDS